MRLDISDFEKRMAGFEKKHQKIIENVLFKTASQVKIDADEIPPKTPHLEGNLRGNYRIIPLKFYLVMIWYMMIYATRWHEATDPEPNWSETGVGPKYLESKLLNYREKYGKLMAELHRAEVNNA